MEQPNSSGRAVHEIRFFSLPENPCKFSSVFVHFTLLFGPQTFVMWGHAVAQMVETLPCKSEGRGFDSQWCH